MSPLPTMSSAPRPSKFQEGIEITWPDLQHTSESNELFYTILSEMDAFEQRRNRSRGLSSSSESSSAATPGTSPNKETSSSSWRVTLGRQSLEIERRPEPQADQVEGKEKVNKLVKRRLRAFTGGKEDAVKREPYPGT